MFGKIVVGIDGSDTSKAALRVACGIAKKFGSEIHLVHVAQPQTVAFALGAIAGYHTVTTMPTDEEIKEATEKVVNSGEEVAETEGVKLTSVSVSRGDPAVEIMAYLDDSGAELIVTGRRGLGNVGALVLGSTSAEIGHRAKCAVLTVA